MRVYYSGIIIDVDNIRQLEDVLKLIKSMQERPLQIQKEDNVSWSISDIIY